MGSGSIVKAITMMKWLGLGVHRAANGDEYFTGERSEHSPEHSEHSPGNNDVKGFG